MTKGKTIALTRWTFVGKVMSLLFNMLSRLVITFLPRSKRLLISWLQSPSAVDFGVHNRWMDKEGVAYISICVYICVYTHTSLYMHYIHYNAILLCHKKEWNLAISHHMDVSGECVISSVLSRHIKHMKRWTLKPLVHHNSRSVTAPCYSPVLFRKWRKIHYWGVRACHPKRHKEKREREHRRDPQPFGSSFYVFFLPLGLPYVNWASRECCLFSLRSSPWSLDLPLFYFHGLFPFLSFSHGHSGLLFPILTT